MNLFLIIIPILLIILLIINKYFHSLSAFFMPKKGNAYSTAYDLGKNYIKRVDFSNLKYPAVMFDIDGTLLDYSGKMILPVIKLLNLCIDSGLLVYIITARLNDYYNETVKQLDKNNIEYEFIFLRNKKDNINTFKSDIKQMLLLKNNITTVMSIGDNIIDINGEYSGYWIKLPNEHDPNLYHLNNKNKFEIVDYS